MKPFAFRLQVLLDLKKKQEEQQKEILGKMEREYQRQKELLKELEEEKSSLYRMMLKERGERLELTRLQAYAGYVPWLEKRIKEQSFKVACLAEELEKSREVLKELMRERKVLERMRWRRYQEYLYQVQREEQKGIDEIATRLYVSKERKGPGGGIVR
ncbi:MAG: flagellar protein FliJ [Eubacteriales bacterium]|nr:flagellar protein FliJ [Eubacteriales bacterium]MDN5363879.1 flagellar protein FliJ [Eubacteriales bacterium]